MNAVDKVLAQLRANKTKQSPQTNYGAAARRIKTPRRTRYRTERLGQIIGHCPTCGLMIGHAEVKQEFDEENGPGMLLREYVTCRKCGMSVDYEDIPFVYKRSAKYDRHAPWGNSSPEVNCYA